MTARSSNLEKKSFQSTINFINRLHCHQSLVEFCPIVNQLQVSKRKKKEENFSIFEECWSNYIQGRTPRVRRR